MKKKFCGSNKEIFDLIKLGKSRKEVAAMFNMCVSNYSYIIKEFEKIGETL